MSKYEDRIKAANERWLKRDAETISKMEKEKHERSKKIAKDFYQLTQNDKTRKKTR